MSPVFSLRRIPRGALGLLAAFAVAGLAGNARADLVRLKNGGEVRGVIDGATSGASSAEVTIETLSGTLIVIERAQQVMRLICHAQCCERVAAEVGGYVSFDQRQRLRVSRFTESAEARIHGNVMQPRTKRGSGRIIAVHHREHLREHILQGVFRITGVAEHQMRSSVNQPLILVEQRCTRVFFPSETLPDQVCSSIQAVDLPHEVVL